MSGASGEPIWVNHHLKGRSRDPFTESVCTGWERWCFHGEGVKWVHADDRYLSCFANSKSSSQRSGICTNPHLSLKQLADWCFSEAERSAEPLYLFMYVSKEVCGSVHKHTWDVTQITLCFQAGCCFSGATTGLQHARDHTGAILLPVLITGVVLADHLLLGPRGQQTFGLCSTGAEGLSWAPSPLFTCTNF